MRLNINDNWKLLHRELDITADNLAEVEAATDFMGAINLPCDVRMPLIRHNIIKDPVVADYCFESEWVENKSWWFMNAFTLSAQDIGANGIRLVLESLDLYADIFVNGKHVGTHQSCHYPFEAEVLNFVKAGLNTLTVRLTAGHEKVTAQQEQKFIKYVCTEKSAHRGDRGDTRRVFLRKPQYVYGWDWAPRVVSIGIMKNAYLNINSAFEVQNVHPVTLDANPSVARMRFDIEVESFAAIATTDATVQLEVRYKNKSILTLSTEIFAQPGTNFVRFDAVIENPQLWWPNGAGEQPLYTLHTTVISNGTEYTGKPVQMGIRTISLNTEKIGDSRRNFSLQVNGKTIFCKGANWIPADSIYARITPEKYETLIKEARECNFNMLRIWGGGIYETDLFYELCDKYGILVWQDFMFACALYPDDTEAFKQDVEKEIDYQTKRLRHHPCFALWCGNNEIQYLFNNAIENNTKQGVSMGMDIFNTLMPKIIQANCPQIPYWRSSPFGGKNPNASEIGNQHFWNEGTMNPDMSKRITPETYDNVTSAFVSEYGYVGPCSEETIQKYHGGHEIARNSDIWNLHNNTFEKETVAAGVQKHYAEPDTLTLPDYLKYARLVQGLMYAYSLESIRFYEHSNGSLFWMYNDAWGEVGWSIIDYYLHRKPSYYYVKRAFAPVKLILRPSRSSTGGEKILVLGANDTSNIVHISVEYGYAGFDGVCDTAEKNISLPPFSKSIIFSFEMPRQDLRQGVIFARASNAASMEIPLALMRTMDFKDYAPHTCTINIEKIEKRGRDYHITIKSTGYCHAVHFEPALRLSDEYFDMLPGQTRTVTAYGAAENIGQEEIRALPTYY